MPPKTRQQEARSEDLGPEEINSEFSVSSPLSAASTASLVMSTDQLQLVLESVLGRFSAPATPGLGSSPAPASTPKIPVPKWTDDVSPWDYFSKYELAQKHNGIARADWGPLLQVYLSGRAQAAYAQVDSTKLDDFDLVKDSMLRSLGDTPEEADRRWWTLRRKRGETSGAFYLRMRSTANRRFYGVVTRDEIFDKVLLSRYLSLLSADCYNCISAKHPRTGEEAAEMVADHESREAFSKSYLAGDSTGHHPQKHHYKREHNQFQAGNVSSKGSGDSQSGNSNGSSPASFNNQSFDQNNQVVVEKDSKKEKFEKKEKKPIVCYGCGEAGHIRPNCPHKVRSVRSPEHNELMSINGWINGAQVNGLRLDTGADRTLVKSEFVPKDAFTGETVVLDSWRGSQLSTHRIANIAIKVGLVEVRARVAVVDNLEYPALLGSDLPKPLMKEMMKIVVEQIDNDPPAVSRSEVLSVADSECVRATRAQAKRQLEEEVADDLASAQADCEPVPLSQMIDLPDAYFDDECEVTPVEQSDTLPGLGSIDIPLPQLSGDSGTASLIAEQQADTSLQKLVELAKKREKGYAFEQGVLFHYTSDGLGDPVQRLVVPLGRRQKVLELGHSNLLAGHSGVKKTYAKIAKTFLWPKMWMQVKAFVRSCAGCQRAARNSLARAPLQPLPVVSEPFSKVAFDLVGPLPRTSSGYKYLLTAMCLYTKYPEAIPLKRVDNVTVLEGWMEVFSKHGFPREILTDQGSVFMSRMTAHMCKTFEVHKVRTSPYHPQSDGALERWHACLKGMFRRSDVDLRNWDKLLKYVLFAYRETPHSVTGYSPFTLLFGREVRGPLALLRSSWAESNEGSCDVGEWLSDVKARMCEMSELVSTREGKAKLAMKKYYDRTATVKTFEPGNMVLVRKPILQGKLNTSWEGPYEIDKQISPVTYSVQVPGKPHKCKVLHCNLLKKWTTPAARIHRVIVMTEEESACEAPSGLRLCRTEFVPSVSEQNQLDLVLVTFCVPNLV